MVQPLVALAGDVSLGKPCVSTAIDGADVGLLTIVCWPSNAGVATHHSVIARQSIKLTSYHTIDSIATSASTVLNGDQ